MSETRGRIPDDFVAAWVLRCGDHDGQPERADTSVAELVDLLRRPSDVPPREGVCPAHLVPHPYVALVSAEGKAVLPQIPSNGCLQPRQDVLDFISAMPFLPVPETGR